MEAPKRDDTQDWILPERARPPLLSELVVRIDEALATARASEAAVMTVGAAALNAAEQARRAADLAEKASEAMLDGQAALEDDDGLRDFSARADRVAARLRELERVAVTPSAPSDVEVLQRAAV